MVTNKSYVALLLPLLLVVAVPGLAWQQQTTELEGDVRQVHDPSIIKDGDTFYLFSTRAGLAIRCSKDLVHWRLCGDVFALTIPSGEVSQPCGFHRFAGTRRVGPQSPGTTKRGALPQKGAIALGSGQYRER